RDLAGNPMAEVSKSIQIDTISPTIATLSVTTQKLSGTWDIASFNSQGYKVGSGILTLDVQFSEVVTPGRLAISVSGFEKIAVLQSSTSNLVGTVARYTTTLTSSDFGYLANVNTINAEIVPTAITDLAGNGIPSTQRYPVIMDFAAPTVTRHGAENDLASLSDDAYYGVIRPYGVSGQQDALQLWFTLNEDALVSRIRIMQVSPNVPVRTIAAFTRTGPDGSEYRFAWDGRNDSGALVGSNRNTSFYYVQIDAADRAGNNAVDNIDGYIKVLHMELGSKWASPLPAAPVSPIVLGGVTVSAIVEVKDWNIQTSADFKAKYPTLPYRIFSDPVGPTWGTYRLIIKPLVSDGAVATLSGTITTPFLPFTMTWNGKYALDYSDVAKRAILVPDGTYRFELIASDNAGNLATTNATGTIQIDNTPPVLGVTISKSYINQLFVTASISVSDTTDTAAQLSVYGDESVAGIPTSPIQTGINIVTGSIPLKSAIQGTHWLSYQSIDRAGNRSALVTASIVLDTVSPQLSMAWNSGQPSSINGVNREVSQNAAIQITASDANLDVIQANLNGQVVVGSQSPIWVVSTWNGTVPLSIAASDRAGNTTTITQSILIDSTVPTFSVGALPAYISTSSVVLNLSNITELNYPIQISKRVDGGAFTGVQSLPSGTSASVGQTWATESTHSIVVQISDRLGNVSVPVTLNSFLDWTLPTASITPIRSGWITTAIGSITITGGDIPSGLGTFKYRWDNADVDNGTLIQSGATTMIPTDGIHVLYLKSIDRAGNVTTTAQTYQQDIRIPTVSVSYYRNQWHTTSLPMIQLTVFDNSPGSGLQRSFYKWNDSQVETGTAATNGTTVIPPGEGANTLWAAVWDIAGNTATWSGTYYVDTVKPVAAATKNSSAWSRTPIGTIVLSATDA
ncbi:hypothetical protein EBR57_06570, partial [bacterium]|nr:hypothetical protein [bacterium]